jgi:hypothetical protein
MSMKTTKTPIKGHDASKKGEKGKTKASWPKTSSQSSKDESRPQLPNK